MTESERTLTVKIGEKDGSGLYKAKESELRERVLQ